MRRVSPIGCIQATDVLDALRELEADSTDLCTSVGPPRRDSRTSRARSPSTTGATRNSLSPVRRTADRRRRCGRGEPGPRRNPGVARAESTESPAGDLSKRTSRIRGYHVQQGDLQSSRRSASGEGVLKHMLTRGPLWHSAAGLWQGRRAMQASPASQSRCGSRGRFLAFTPRC
jgi:hypothetical protein